MPDNSGFYGGHNVGDFKTFLQKWVAEVVFVRRRRAKNSFVTARTRRMICTLNFPLLIANKKIFNFRPPTKSPSYNAESKGLVTVWDIIMQDWRNIDIKTARIIQKSNIEVEGLPMYVNSKVDMGKFLNFYDKKIARMTVGDKRKFMDT